MTKEIPLTKGLFALIDDEDYEMLRAHKWQATNHAHTAYAGTDINRKRIYMHRMIMNAPDGLKVDHINGNGLDNRRSNLRLATQQQNIAHMTRPKTTGASKYYGVYLASNKRAWFAQIVVNRRCIYLGIYRTQRDAAIAYNQASLKYNGEFATLNYIPEQPDPDDIPFPEPSKPERFSSGHWTASRRLSA